LVALPRPVRLKDLEDHTGIASAKLHRYLVSMIRCGLVRRHEAAAATTSACSPTAWARPRSTTTTWSRCWSR
jgi:predicted transcriptional regulator